MFDILNSLVKTAVNVVTLPISGAADVVTLAGALTDKDKPYTAKTVEDIVKNLENAGRPVR
jgi:uncharacterized protein (DUF2147 family)